MKLSTRATYGLRAVMAIAASPAGEPVMIKDIAERQKLPATYLEQLMVPLRKSGLLSATRGAHGGYKLSRPAQTITIREIIEILEGPLELVECADITCCGLQPDACALKDLFSEATHAILHVFESVTLAELLERQQAKEANASLMYVI
ncbi:MAG TPA: Rrf2 family transcriptional regulator [Armatimonadota bacterium]|nr:Rrf2 family transcriptional regulator [Armatimonadota bacterium]